jgi:hypothetical protein
MQHYAWPGQHHLWQCRVPTTARQPLPHCSMVASAADFSAKQTTTSSRMLQGLRQTKELLRHAGGTTCTQMLIEVQAPLLQVALQSTTRSRNTTAAKPSTSTCAPTPGPGLDNTTTSQLHVDRVTLRTQRLHVSGFPQPCCARPTASTRVQHAANLDESSESTGTVARLCSSAWALATRAAVSARNPNQLTCRRGAVILR